MSNIEFKKEDLENVAMLSRLALSEKEKEIFLEQMKEVLEYVGQVSEMASGDIENSGGVNYGKQFENSINKNTIREDNVLNEANSYTEVLLNDAPEVEENFIKVSQVLDKHKK
jgi:aspartyl/glutamyl-tRNA(Asn/Gln) amidotransferase C subunit